MKSTALLLDDHKYILRVLEVLEEMATRARHGQEPDGQDLKDILEFLERFCDRIHQGREEGILFPALLRDRSQKNYPKLSSLLFDHNRERFLVQGLQESLLASSRRDFVFCATRLVEVLREHINEEEATLFPLADSTFSHADDAQIAADMKGFDKLWQDKMFPALLSRLDELESKYLGKAHAKVRASRKKSDQESRNATDTPTLKT